MECNFLSWQVAIIMLMCTCRGGSIVSSQHEGTQREEDKMGSNNKREKKREREGEKQNPPINGGQ